MRGEGPEDLMDASYTLAAQMLVGAGKASDFETGYRMAEKTIADGSAFEKFCAFIEAQGGDADYARNPERFPKAPVVYEVKSGKSGYISGMQTEEIGLVSLVLGAGRETKESEIDLSAGICMKAKIGDKVECGQIIAHLYTSDITKAESAKDRLLAAVEISDKPAETGGHVLAIIS